MEFCKLAEFILQGKAKEIVDTDQFICSLRNMVYQPEDREDCKEIFLFKLTMAIVCRSTTENIAVYGTMVDALMDLLLSLLRKGVVTKKLSYFALASVKSLFKDHGGMYDVTLNKIVSNESFLELLKPRFVGFAECLTQNPLKTENFKKLLSTTLIVIRE